MFTPSVEELTMVNPIVCTEQNCGSVFKNRGNLYLHLKRHHNNANVTGNADTPPIEGYHCPEENCVYHASQNQSECKYFANMKYLRQHYRKVHMAKIVLCERCGKKFLNEMELRRHTERHCGKVFLCKECGYKYDSVEALKTHGKRKSHDVGLVEGTTTRQKETEPRSKRRPTRKAREEKPIGHHKETQTVDDLFPVDTHMMGVQTDDRASEEMSTIDVSTMTTSLEYDELQLFLRDIETQTDRTVSYGLDPSATRGFFDPILSHTSSTHMHTQTCDDFLTDLELTNMQTQTNLSTTDSSTNFSYDDLLVSTETQTSFTQCLFDSCVNTESSNRNTRIDEGGDGCSGGGGGGVGDGGSTDPAFGGMYTTQYTQTCDTLLESIFGGQQNLFLVGNGFSSTHTQT